MSKVLALPDKLYRIELNNGTVVVGYLTDARTKDDGTPIMIQVDTQDDVLSKAWVPFDHIVQMREFS